MPEDVTSLQPRLPLTTGSTYRFRTCENTLVRGQVIAFDDSLKVLVVREKVGAKYLLRLFNSDLLTDMQEEAGPTGETWQDLARLTGGSTTSPEVSETRKQANERYRQSSAMPAPLPLVAQNVFLQLKRTLDKVKWVSAGSGASPDATHEICVLDRVLVGPPWTAAGVRPISKADDEAASEQVRKILSKPFTAVNHLVPCGGGSLSSTSATTATGST